MIIVEARPCNRVREVKSLLMSAGNQIGSVWFKKRSDGSLRKMSYRLHVQSPTYASKPEGKKARGQDANSIIVFDTNKMKYDKKGRMCGRGDYRTVPLENVVRVKVGGVIHKII